ncbi:MAG: C-terminal binding protein, partial [Candidatus Methylomirabilales bacterium]
MPPLVVITDLDHPSVVEEEAELAAVGARLLVAQCRTEQEVLAAGAEADGLIVQYAPITAAVLAGLPRCRVVARYGVGVDNLDVAAATSRGVVVANVPGFCTEEVASHALAFLLAWHRKLRTFDRAVKDGGWDFALAGPTPRLRGQVLGIVGVGRIGSALARLAAPLGLEVWGHDPYRADFPPAVRRVPFEELVAGADYLSLSVPLTAETHHMVNATVLRRMRPTTFLVNTSRGAVVDEAALVRALQ